MRKWTVKDLKPALSGVETGRSFIRGKKLYTGLCAKCHLFKGQGGAIGPDLTSVGNKMKPEALLSELLTTAMMKDESDLVRKEAIVALGNLYNKRYNRQKPVAALIAVLSTLQSEDMKNMVAESIEMLTGRSFGVDADRWERWFGANRRKLSPSR